MTDTKFLQQMKELCEKASAGPWEHYIGVMRQFDYCTICDEKRDIKSVFEGI